jgi:hypothetical protein
VQQDIVFGSEGTARADFERMEEVHRDIGLSTAFSSGNGVREPEIKGDGEKVQHV